MIPRVLLLATAALLLAGTVACDNSGGYLAEQGRRRRLAEQGRRHRLAELGVQPFDSTGRYALEGVSTLGRDTLDGAFKTFRARCQACHDLPAPGSKPAYLWDATLSRMRKDVAEAGLMPWSSMDEAAIRRFLEDHTSDRR